MASIVFLHLVRTSHSLDYYNLSMFVVLRFITLFGKDHFYNFLKRNEHFHSYFNTIKLQKPVRCQHMSYEMLSALEI